jgi:regulator of sigma E protease
MTAVIEATLAFVVVLGILVLIHEFGHFAMAKLLRIRVEAFSVGFGPRLFGVRRGDTDYRVSAIPLGGYVKMTGENPDEVATGDPAELSSRPRWQRFLVFVMGALLNIVLAVVVMAVVFYRTGAMLDTPKTPPVVKEVAAGSSAEKAGVRPGDRIVQIEGKDARDPAVMVEEIFLSPGTEKTLLLQRDGGTIKARIEIGSDSRYHSGETGMKLAFDEDESAPNADTNRVEEVRAASPAEKAGLKAGDRIVAIGGRELPGRSDLVSQIRSSAGKPVALGILRGSQRLEVEVTPESVEGAGQIGIAFPHPRLTVGQSLRESVRYNMSNAAVLFITLKKLVRGDVSPRVMSGPGEIAAAARQAAHSGLDPFLHFLAFVSLQLGIINLLPIPMLDGGHVFILLVEGTIRRELSTVLKERVMQAGLVFLLLFAGVVIYFDIVKMAF